MLPLLRAAGLRVVTIDLLGFGLAPKPRDCAYDYQAHVSHLRDELERAGLAQRSLTLVGHSMGALIAQRYARMYPDAVEGVVLLHPPLYATSEQARQTLRATGAYYRFLLDSPRRNLAWPLVRWLSAGRLRHYAWSRERSLSGVIERAEAFTDMSSLPVKSLLVVGSGDRPQYLQNVRDMGVPGHVELKVVDTGHHSPRRNPSLASSLVVEYVRAVRNAG